MARGKVPSYRCWLWLNCWLWATRYCCMRGDLNSSLKCCSLKEDWTLIKLFWGIIWQANMLPALRWPIERCCWPVGYSAHCSTPSGAYRVRSLRVPSLSNFKTLRPCADCCSAAYRASSLISCTGASFTSSGFCSSGKSKICSPVVICSYYTGGFAVAPNAVPPLVIGFLILGDLRGVAVLAAFF